MLQDSGFETAGVLLCRMLGELPAGLGAVHGDGLVDDDSVAEGTDADGGDGEKGGILKPGQGRRAER